MGPTAYYYYRGKAYAKLCKNSLAIKDSKKAQDLGYNAKP